MNCAVYCRVSTVGQKDNYSVAVQKSRGLAFCSEHGYEAVLFEEQASAASLFREQFQKLLKDIEAGQIEALWVIEFSRLSRDEEDAIYLRKLFVQHQIKLYIDGQLTDLTKPENVFIYQINSAVSTFERSRTTERIGRGVHQRMDEGRMVYAMLFGYDYIYDKEGKRQIAINQKEAETVKRLFNLYEEGWSSSRLMKMLWKEGIRGKTGKQWWASSLGGLFQQPAYCGHQYNSKKELIPSRMYPGIVSLAQWKRVNKLLARNSRERKQTASRRARFELSSVIKCGVCGSAFYKSHSPKTLVSGKVYIKQFYVHLHTSKKAHVCNQHPKYIAQTKAEQLIRALYTDCFTNDKEIKKFIDIQAKEVQNERKALDGRIGTIEKRLVELEKQRQRLFGLVRAGLAEMPDLSTHLGEVNREKADLEKSLQEATEAVRAKEANIEDLIEQFRG
ncbi:MAG: recombinase family protein, partial [Spirochaetia bacterium]